MYKRDLEFLFEVGSLRYLERGWRQHLGMTCADILEHTMRVMLLALIIARKENVKDEEKIMKMALVHDLAETRTTDLSYIQKVYVKTDEDKSADALFADTTLKDLRDGVLREYEERKSVEARIVKDADNIDIDLELKELEQRGSQLPKKWQKIRKMVRDKKLYTKSARQLWDELAKTDPDDWHMTANKWLKIPNAGK